jgi:hypothetical protein
LWWTVVQSRINVKSKGVSLSRFEAAFDNLPMPGVAPAAVLVCCGGRGRLAVRRPASRWAAARTHPHVITHFFCFRSQPTVADLAANSAYFRPSWAIILARAAPNGRPLRVPFSRVHASATIQARPTAGDADEKTIYRPCTPNALDRCAASSMSNGPSCSTLALSIRALGPKTPIDPATSPFP